MWKNPIGCKTIVFFLAAFLLVGCATQKVQEKKFTINYKDTAIETATYGNVEVTNVKPELKIPKGRKRGRLNVTVELKNTGTKPDSYYVFASGVSQEGISSGGNLIIPEKGFMQPGEKGKGKIRTRFQGKGLPSTITLEVYSSVDLGHEPDLLEILAK